ncbi:type II secretion system F family protein [Motiliproteus sp. SC1-56]|uniref:type II secretion system F family protein n=1 Tax=Motiliproteus sp. SC1-56 TaxID=2799565 RepID=UPI001A8C6831|nr:type II secretion system F family protein [Motiliproteus sp. SC1-56]
MPSFHYRATSYKGEVVQGTLTGVSVDDVAEQLQAQKLIPLQIGDGSKRAGLALGWRSQKASLSEINTFTQEFATMLQAGLPLEKTLRLLATVNESGQVRAALEDTVERIRSGSTLGDAFAAQKGIFSPFYISLIRSGEASGALNTVLTHLAAYLERSKWLRDTLISALIYPVILASVALASVLLLLTFVVPQFEQLFEGMEQLLPLSTRITIAAGDWVRDYGWIAALAAAAGVVLGWHALKVSASFRYHCHRLVARLPMIGPLTVKVETARFCRMLSILLSNGVALLKALQIARDTQRSEVMRAGLAQVSTDVSQGRRLAEAISDQALFPPLAEQMIAVGEESGELENMLEKVANWYDSDIQSHLKRALSMLEPLLILVLGAVIAWVVISILLAMLSVNELAF